jgi:hypothetical protein
MLILKPLSIDWSVAGAEIPAVTFISQAGLTTRELAHMLDSLVRVSRRVGWNHFINGQTANEFQQARSLTGGQATIHLKFSSLAN